MTEEGKQKIAGDAVLRLKQISATLACIREQLDRQPVAGDAIGMVEQFADWTADELHQLTIP